MTKGIGKGPHDGARVIQERVSRLEALRTAIRDGKASDPSVPADAVFQGLGKRYAGHTRAPEDALPATQKRNAT